MSLSKYEAIALSNLLQDDRNLPDPSQFLVVDLDDNSFGICSASSKGSTKLLANPAETPALDYSEQFIDLLLTAFPSISANDLERYMAENQKEMTRALKNYYFSRQLSDSEIISVNTVAITCTNLIAAETDLLSHLMDLIQNISETLEKTKSSIENMQILVCGKAASQYLILYHLLDAFSDPAISDPNFKTIIDPHEIGGMVDFGTNAQIRLQNANTSLVLILYEREGDHKRRIPLIRKDQKKAELFYPVYSEPFFCCPDDHLTLEQDGVIREVRIPAEMKIVKFGMCEVGAVLENDRPVLHFRRTDEPQVHCSKCL